MEFLTHFLINITLFGGGMCLLMSAEQLNQKKIAPFNIRFSATLFVNGLFLLQTGLYLSGFFQNHPWAFLFYFTVILMIGPVNIWFNTFFIQSDFSIKKVIHLLPGILGILLDLSLYVKGQAFVGRFIDKMMSEPGFTLIKVPFVLAAMHTFSYFAYGFITQLTGIWGDRELFKKTYHFPLRTFIALCSIAVIIFGIIISNSFVVACGTATISINMMLAFLYYSQIREFFQKTGHEIKESKYKRSLLKGMKTSLIQTRLEELMTEERLYEELELNLESLAGKLFITPQQLSQFLNEEMQMNFRNYINRFRIQEAQKQLFEEKEKNVLNICFDVGFSSKSAFYTAFKKETDMTPGQFRDLSERQIGEIKNKNIHNPNVNPESIAINY